MPARMIIEKIEKDLFGPGAPSAGLEFADRMRVILSQIAAPILAPLIVDHHSSAKSFPIALARVRAPSAPAAINKPFMSFKPFTRAKRVPPRR